MGDPMRIRASFNEGLVDVKVLMSHPMETGQRRDTDGKLIPARYINRVTATCNGRQVLSADWGPSVSKNPFLAFRFRGAAKGDKVSISWLDTAGDNRTDDTTIA